MRPDPGQPALTAISKKNLREHGVEAHGSSRERSGCCTERNEDLNCLNVCFNSGYFNLDRREENKVVEACRITFPQI